MSSDWTAGDFIGGSLCLDFANTLGGYRKEREIERLERYEDAVGWAHHAGLVTPGEADALLRRADAAPDKAASDLARLKRLREAIHGVFSARARGVDPASDDIEALRQASIAAMGMAALDREGGWTIAAETAGLRIIEARIGLAAFSLGRDMGGLALKECGRCPWLFIDSSKNRRRLWCDSTTCGNRARSERHYHRQTAHLPT